LIHFCSCCPVKESLVPERNYHTVWTVFVHSLHKLEVVALSRRSRQAGIPGHAGVMNIVAALPLVSNGPCGCCSILEDSEQRSVLVRGYQETHSSRSPPVRVPNVPKTARPASPRVSAFLAIPGPRELAAVCVQCPGEFVLDDLSIIHMHPPGDLENLCSVHYPLSLPYILFLFCVPARMANTPKN
jgi:hypothetical protein